MEIIKNTIRVGNSAGVLLPKKWLNTQVKITLEPLNIERDIIEILINEGILKDTLGIYLAGSYARNEQEIESDIDIIAITSNISKNIKRERYDITCLTIKELEEQIENNAFPIIPMLREAKTIMNNDLIKKYSLLSITKKNIKYYVETTFSALDVIKKDIELSREIKSNVSDASAYSLVLRLRTIYIIKCLKESKKCSKKSFLDLVKKVSGSLTAYERYVSSKKGNSLDYNLPIGEAEKLVNYIYKEDLILERWIKE